MPEPLNVDRQLLVLRIIVASIILGLVVFTVLVVAIGEQQQKQPELGRAVDDGISGSGHHRHAVADTAL